MGLDPFTEDDRRLIVTAREHFRHLERQPASRWLLAVHMDRESEDYARDPDAINPPSQSYMLGLWGIHWPCEGTSVRLPGGAGATGDDTSDSDCPQ